MTTLSGLPLSTDEVSLAAANYEAQENLFSQLQTAFKMSQLPESHVAEELDLSVDEFREWLYGDVNLTLAQLRQLANAVDSQITYRARAVRTRFNERIATINDQLWAQSSNSTSWSALPQKSKVYA